MNDMRRIARLAYKLHAALRANAPDPMRDIDRQLSSFCLQLETIGTLRTKLAICTSQHWNEAARRLLDRVPLRLRELGVGVRECERILDRINKPAPSLGFAYEEVRQLQHEFGEVLFHHEDTTLVVITEPITLKDVPLGPFELRLALNGRAGPGGYSLRVIALEPNPAVSDESVTHPHVSGEELCTGEAAVAMREAFADGRICDFFLVVCSVLQTYNSQSPYVALEKWDGRPCHNCGEYETEDCCCWCGDCENEFCESCSGLCQCCETVRCNGCLSGCAACDESCCCGCLEACGNCGEACCSGCREDGLCLSCKEEQENPDEDDIQEESGTQESRTSQGKRTAPQAIEPPACATPLAG